MFNTIAAWPRVIGAWLRRTGLRRVDFQDAAAVALASMTPTAAAAGTVIFIAQPWASNREAEDAERARLWMIACTIGCYAGALCGPWAALSAGLIARVLVGLIQARWPALVGPIEAAVQLVVVAGAPAPLGPVPPAPIA